MVNDSSICGLCYFVFFQNLKNHLFANMIYDKPCFDLKWLVHTKTETYTYIQYILKKYHAVLP